MKYFETEFTISPFSDDASDIVAALAGEAGYETFENTPTGLKGYVQQALYDEPLLQQMLSDFPFEGVSIGYVTREAEDADWNAQWEQEGFAPIAVKSTDSCREIIIHDGRHLPEDLEPANSNQDYTLSTVHPSSVIPIEIDARLAFGTGNHETTRMICAALLDLDGLGTDTRVLDCGTGTGILSICALKLGAGEAVGYDIDEWSVDNSRHNAIINRVDERFTPLLGDVNILNKVEGEFSLVMANINRNILMADLPVIHKKMAPGATLILSGFYVADSQILITKAEELGLHLMEKKEEQDWACLILR